MTLQELAMDTPEADAMARRILTALYECAAAAQGAKLGTLTITRLPGGRTGTNETEAEV